MVSKMRGIQLARGERVRLETPGGGGWGHAAGRTAPERQADSAMGYVTTGTHAGTNAGSSDKKASE
jgi:N-methylhydantoinase B